MDKEEYHEYLKSPEWKATRAASLKYGANKCAICGKTDTLQVHHNSYERLRAELRTDLVVLCAYHHSLIHASQEEDEAGKPRIFDYEDLESHIRCLVSSIAAIDQIIDPHYRGVARDAIISDLAGTLFAGETYYREGQLHITD